ncbi:hypothetical protein Tco_1138529 [Tanacetum coccineum]
MEVTTNPQVTIQNPTYPTSNIASTSRTQPVTPVYPDTQLRLRGVTTRFEYSSEDVDEDIQMEGPPGFQLQPSANTKIQGKQNLPPLLAAHHREIEQRRMTFSPTYARRRVLVRT